MIPPVGDEPIWAVWMAAFHAPTLAIADELGLFGILRETPLRADELATRLDLELHSVEAIAGVMTSLQFLSLVDDRYALAPVARTYLLADSPYYWGGMLRRVRENPIDCRKLIGSLRAKKAKSSATLTEMWSAPVPPPEALVAFTHAMHAHSFALALRVVASFALPHGVRVLDVAGGSGSYSIALAMNDPTARCTLLDLPPVCEVARDYAARHGVADRIHTVAGNMFEDAWPAGHDAVFMADIFHDWDDVRCQRLASRAFAALAPGGKILLHEMLLAETKDGPRDAVAYSMIMVLITEGRQRSASELTRLLEDAGFVDVRIQPTANGYALVEATRP